MLLNAGSSSKKKKQVEYDESEKRGEGGRGEDGHMIDLEHHLYVVS
jgi:hypothetical protein